MIARLLLVLGLGVGVASACEWDRDTLQMERRRFPTAFELIAGKFLKHSDAYYRWRIRDRTAKLAAGGTVDQQLAWLDDLGVAHDKLGESDQAIAAARRAEALKPGRYETAANLGTFLVHAGKLEDGLAQIRRAIEINPDAHFGREITQAQLIAYAISRRVDGELPIPAATRMGAFATYLAKQQPEGRLTREAHQAAVKGVLGMLRFGDNAHPVLLEALGDLLTTYAGDGDNKLLACRAYLRASRLVKDPAAAHAYRERAHEALVLQTVPGTRSTQLELSAVEAALTRELAEAEAYVAAIAANEARWIAAGKDVDAEFDRVYYDADDDGLADTPTDTGSADVPTSRIWTLVGIGLLAAVALAVATRRSALARR